MATHGVKLETLKDCLQFLKWFLSDKHGPLMQDLVTHRLDKLLKKMYVNVNQSQIASALSTFLKDVSKFYDKLCAKTIGLYTGNKTAKNALNALLECIPKVLSAAYFLRYQVDDGFKALGGGDWAGEEVGKIAWFASYNPEFFTRMKATAGKIDKYLIKRNGDQYGVIPGGFDAGELKPLSRGEYSQGKDMLTDLKAILDKHSENTNVQNYFIDVFSTTVLSTSGTDIPNIANAIRLVQDFCTIFGDVKDAKDFRMHLYSKDRCMDWQKLRDHCLKVKKSFEKIFTGGRFSFTGYGRKPEEVNKNNMAKKMASCFKTHLQTVMQILNHIEPFNSKRFPFKSRSFQRGTTLPPGYASAFAEYFIKHFIPYGFTFYFHKYEMKSTNYQVLFDNWREVIEDFKKSGGGLDELVKILNGQECPQQADDNDDDDAEEEDVEEPEPPDDELLDDGTTKPVATKSEATKTEADKAEGAQNQGKKAEGAQKQGKKAEGTTNEASPRSKPTQPSGVTREDPQSSASPGPSGDQGQGAQAATSGAGQTSGQEGQVDKNAAAATTTLQDYGSSASAPNGGGGGSGHMGGCSNPIRLPDVFGGGNYCPRDGSLNQYDKYYKTWNETPPTSSKTTLKQDASTLQNRNASASSSDSRLQHPYNHSTRGGQTGQGDDRLQSNVFVEGEAVEAVYSDPRFTHMNFDEILSLEGHEQLDHSYLKNQLDDEHRGQEAQDHLEYYYKHRDETQRQIQKQNDEKIKQDKQAAENKFKSEVRTQTAIKRLQQQNERRLKDAETFLDRLKKRQEARAAERSKEDDYLKSELKMLERSLPVLGGVTIPNPVTVFDGLDGLVSQDDTQSLLDPILQQQEADDEWKVEQQKAYEEQEEYFQKLKDVINRSQHGGLFNGVKTTAIKDSSPYYDNTSPRIDGIELQHPSQTNEQQKQEVNDAHDYWQQLYTKQVRLQDEEDMQIKSEFENSKRRADFIYQQKTASGEKQYYIDVLNDKKDLIKSLKGGDVYISHPDIPIARKSDNVDFDLQIDVPKRPIPNDSYDLDLDGPPPFLKPQPLDPIGPATPTISLNIGPPDPLPDLPDNSAADYTHNPSTVQMCLAPWTTQTPTPGSTDIPETELFPSEAPRTVRDMLQWLAGLRNEKHHKTLEKCMNKAFNGLHSDPKQLAFSVNGTYITPKAVIDILQLTAMFAGSVLNSIAPNWKANVSSRTVKPKSSEEPDCCALLCQLRDYVYAAHHQLQFLKAQCNRNSTYGGWQYCKYGNAVSPSDSPLQAFLTDGWDSDFETHPFDPCNLCHKSRGQDGIQGQGFA